MNFDESHPFLILRSSRLILGLLKKHKDALFGYSLLEASCLSEQNQ
jgi:hypothetical protein